MRAEPGPRGCIVPGRMGFVFTVAAGLVVWIVLWALGAKGFDAFMVTTIVILVGATAKLLVPFLPGRQE